MTLCAETLGIKVLWYICGHAGFLPSAVGRGFSKGSRVQDSAVEGFSVAAEGFAAETFPPKAY